MRANNLADKKKLWLRWVAANALGELLGLGLTFAAIGLVFSGLESQEGTGAILVTFGAAIASGVLEATLVGLAQWWAMRPWFPTIARLTWWGATLAGALLAYGLGYLPSTLMSLADPSSTAPVAEPPQWLVLLLAAGLGLVAGAILALAQWLVLRRHVSRARRWLPANMLAWMIGMPLIFWGVDAAFERQSGLEAALLLAGVLLVTGAVVGAIHGAFLVGLVEEPPAAGGKPAGFDDKKPGSEKYCSA